MNFSLFLNGIKTGVRQKKRFMVFGLLFTILSGMLIIQGLRLDSYNTDNLVRARGVVLDGAYFESDVNKVANLVQGERGIYSLYYGKIPGTDVGIISPRARGDPPSGEINWILSDVSINPSTLVKGHFPSNRDEVLINSNYTIYIGEDVEIKASAVGTEFSLYGNDLEVTGVYPKSAVKDLSGGAGNLIYVDWDVFNVLRKGKNLKIRDKPIQRIVVTAEGSYIFGSAMENREQIYKSLKKNKFDHVNEGQLRPPEYRRVLLQTLFTFISSLILVAVYSYLVVRFRRDEIATLRAIGWSGSEIKQYVLAELFALVMISYLISLFFSIVAANYFIGIPAKSLLTFLGTLGVAFLSLGFGWLIISKGTLKVSPMEAFRKR